MLPIVKGEIEGTLWYLARALLEMGYSFDEAAVDNLNKLSDRKDRGVLAGTGDDR